ncbi:nuclear transport factor 2 family protein [Hyphococcus luteus]|uniref:Limonene-1,2-epoxide hydrolase n=1 Tax=Hyphococcus luteus TaxID=2058213 RepID=A0A2S7K0F4_9PROT|nr:nuclear transport factor 2 family protein [Marinicaulis flavus]PQA85982.1 limonene-1,2-epoxide hydrolase [Marinicaulis flavus]
MSNYRQVEGIIDAWRRKDIDAVLNHVDEDVEYHYLVGVQPLRGKDEMRALLEKFGAGQSEIRWRIVNAVENGDMVMVEGVDDYVDARGRRIQTPYMGVFEFENGKVRRWRDYLDPALVKKDKAGEAQAEWVKALIGRA